MSNKNPDDEPSGDPSGRDYWAISPINSESRVIHPLQLSANLGPHFPPRPNERLGTTPSINSVPHHQTPSILPPGWSSVYSQGLFSPYMNPDPYSHPSHMSPGCFRLLCVPSTPRLIDSRQQPQQQPQQPYPFHASSSTPVASALFPQSQFPNPYQQVPYRPSESIVMNQNPYQLTVPVSASQQQQVTTGTEKKKKKKKKSDDEDAPCLICGDYSSGLHYGIRSCEGCKGFFKRSMANERVYKCKYNKNCPMTRKDRNRCQYCRLKTCLERGMNRKAIREDGMPGGRNKSIGPVVEPPELIEEILTGKFWKRKRANEAAKQISVLNLQRISADGKVEQARNIDSSASSESDGNANQRPGTSGKRSQGRGSRRSRKRKNSEKALGTKNGIIKRMHERQYDCGLQALIIPSASGMPSTSGVPSNSSVPGTPNTPRTSLFRATRPESQEEQPMDLRKSTVFEGSVAKSVSSPTSLSCGPIYNGVNHSIFGLPPRTVDAMQKLVLVEDTRPPFELPMKPTESSEEGLVQYNAYIYLMEQIDEMATRLTCWAHRMMTYLYLPLSKDDLKTLILNNGATNGIVESFILHHDSFYYTLNYFASNVKFTDEELKDLINEEDSKIIDLAVNLWLSFSSIKFELKDYVLLKACIFFQTDNFTVENHLNVNTISNLFKDAFETLSCLQTFGSNHNNHNLRLVLQALPNLRFLSAKFKMLSVQKLMAVVKSIFDKVKCYGPSTSLCESIAAFPKTEPTTIQHQADSEKKPESSSEHATRKGRFMKISPKNDIQSSAKQNQVEMVKQDHQTAIMMRQNPPRTPFLPPRHILQEDEDIDVVGDEPGTSHNGLDLYQNPNRYYPVQCPPLLPCRPSTLSSTSTSIFPSHNSSLTSYLVANSAATCTDPTAMYQAACHAYNQFNASAAFVRGFQRGFTSDMNLYSPQYQWGNQPNFPPTSKPDQ